MDIKKEIEAFEKEAFKQSGGWATFTKAYGDVYENKQLNFAWSMWLAAKQQAVPEGFVVVPVEPTQVMLDKFPEVVYQDTYAGECSVWVDDETIKTGYKAMIQEAQK